MINIEVVRSLINGDLLDQELKTQLPGLVFGISTGGGIVIVHLDATVTAANITTATRTVENHDETKLTVEQQRRQQQETDIQTDRATYLTPLDPNSITLTSLARRIVWLENELRQLRGL